MGICSSQPKKDQVLPTDARRSSGVSRRQSLPGTTGKEGAGTLLSGTWAFDNFDLDLEGADWRFSFRESRVFKSSAALLALRFFLAIATTVLMALSMLEYSDDGSVSYWFLHLASWTQLAVLASVWTIFVSHVTALIHAEPPDLADEATAPRGTGTPWFISLSFACYAIALPFTVIVLVLHYLHLTGARNLYIGVLSAHWINFIIMALTFISSEFSYHILHTAYAMLFGIIYLCFTYLAFLAGWTAASGEPFVFAGLDWSGRYHTTGALVVTVGTIVNALVWFVIAYWRQLTDTNAWNRIYAWQANAEVVISSRSGKAPQGAGKGTLL
mmetsp:Transcript_19483/g.52448  ORF Transcript_19483/g.52448 Transcript_19483/m.52448 type:complete len:328 (+) Transcript_19483:34-1017(+)